MSYKKIIFSILISFISLSSQSSCDDFTNSLHAYIKDRSSESVWDCQTFLNVYYPDHINEEVSCYVISERARNRSRFWQRLYRIQNTSGGTVPDWIYPFAQGFELSEWRADSELQVLYVLIEDRNYSPFLKVIFDYSYYLPS